jgi:hypothetical protein
MQVLVVLAVLLVAGLLWLLRGGGGSDAPARIVAVAAGLLPEHRRGWGRAMAAELAQIHGHGRRWRFAAGAVRVALLPPPRRRNRVLAAALAGLAAAAGATVVAASEVPGLSVFAAVLGLRRPAATPVRGGRPSRLRPGAVRSAPAGAGPGPRACCWQSCGRWRSPGSARPTSAWPGRRRPRTARRAAAGAPPSP